ASCHERARTLPDGRPVAVGLGGRRGRRNTPQIFNLAYSPVFLWDGRAPTLEDAVRAALTNPVEMGMTDDAVSRALGPDAPELERVLGAVPGTASVAGAIAAYVASLRAGGSRADRFLYCGDRSALTDREAVVDFYSRGGGRRAGVDRDVVPLGLDRLDRQALVAFLEALTSQDLEPPRPSPAGAIVAGGR